MLIASFMITRFNFSVEEYIIWIARTSLVERMLSQARVDQLQLSFVKSISTADSGNIDMSKITYSMAAIIEKSLLESWLKEDMTALARIKPMCTKTESPAQFPAASSGSLRLTYFKA